MSFLHSRNALMQELVWSRKLATLVARMVLGVDTYAGISSCESFNGKPLLTPFERREIGSVGFDRIREIITR